MFLPHHGDQTMWHNIQAQWRQQRQLAFCTGPDGQPAVAGRALQPGGPAVPGGHYAHCVTGAHRIAGHHAQRVSGHDLRPRRRTGASRRGAMQDGLLQLHDGSCTAYECSHSISVSPSAMARLCKDSAPEKQHVALVSASAAHIGYRRSTRRCAGACIPSLSGSSATTCLRTSRRTCSISLTSSAIATTGEPNQLMPHCSSRRNIGACADSTTWYIPAVFIQHTSS